MGKVFGYRKPETDSQHYEAGTHLMLLNFIFILSSPSCWEEGNCQNAPVIYCAWIIEWIVNFV